LDVVRGRKENHITGSPASDVPIASDVHSSPVFADSDYRDGHHDRQISEKHSDIVDEEEVSCINLEESE